MRFAGEAVDERSRVQVALGDFSGFNPPMTHPSIRIRAALLAVALSMTGVIGSTVGTTTSLAVVDFDGYIAKAAKAAKASKKAYGVPRAVTIAQSILESGWGRSQLTTKYNNYFGIKCSALVSPYQRGCVSLASYEYVKGKKKKYKKFNNAVIC